jgi:hypothetical protein
MWLSPEISLSGIAGFLGLLRNNLKLSYDRNAGRAIEMDRASRSPDMRFAAYATAFQHRRMTDSYTGSGAGR